MICQLLTHSLNVDRCERIWYEIASAITKRRSCNQKDSNPIIKIEVSIVDHNVIIDITFILLGINLYSR